MKYEICCKLNLSSFRDIFHIKENSPTLGNNVGKKLKIIRPCNVIYQKFLYKLFGNNIRTPEIIKLSINRMQKVHRKLKD